MSSRSAVRKQLTLPNGLTLRLNDHVFVAAPYDDRAGDPYNIGRVQEFLPEIEQIRVNFYVRPRDIGSRMAMHGRRLLATMHSDLVPVQFVRGTCTVLHRDYIPDHDEEAYRKRPDCFYFNQYFDRYLHRYFDVVPVERLRNAPASVLQYLCENFSYVLCEAHYVSDLCDELDSCAVCKRPAAPVDSVSCEVCSRHFHMRCLDPPLAGKPKKGFGFTCAPCSHKQEEEYEQYLAGNRAAPPGSGRFANKGKAKATQQQQAATPPPPASPRDRWRSSHGWPWRYFGAFTRPEDVVDPHDPLYPRAASRLGPKFQQALAADKSTPVASTSKFKNPPIARGEDSEVDAIYIPPPSEEDEDLDEFLEQVKSMPLYESAGVNLLNSALLKWKADPSAAKAAVAKMNKRDFRLTNWSIADVAKIDEILEDFGDDIAEVSKLMPNKTLAELVNFVYVKRPAINNRVDTKHEDDKFAGAVLTGISAVKDAAEVADRDFETESLVPSPPPRSKRKNGPCAVCEAKDSPAWYRCPGQTGNFWSAKEKTLCEGCSVQWRHYANDLLYTDDSRSRSRNKHKAKEKEKARSAQTPDPVIDSAALDSMLSPASSLTPEPEEPFRQELVARPCVLCKRMDPKVTLAQCQRCSICCHVNCCGLNPDTSLYEWLCELCTDVYPSPTTVMATSKTPAQFRARTFPTPVDMSCALCPPGLQHSSYNEKGSTLSAIDVFRRTEFNNLVHYICAVWHPEIKFADPVVPTIAEGAASIPMSRRRQECAFCTKADVGALVQCADCNAWFHVGCAWMSACRFGFEIVAPPAQRKRDKDAPVVVSFKEAKGSLVPRIWCKSHKIEEIRRAERKVFELGEKDPDSLLTTIATYMRSYKLVPATRDHPNLKRATRKDAMLWPALQHGSLDDPMLPKPGRGHKRSSLMAESERAASPVREASASPAPPPKPKSKSNAPRQPVKKQPPPPPKPADPPKPKGRSTRRSQAAQAQSNGFSAGVVLNGIEGAANGHHDSAETKPAAALPSPPQPQSQLETQPQLAPATPDTTADQQGDDSGLPGEKPKAVTEVEMTVPESPQAPESNTPRLKLKLHPRSPSPTKPAEAESENEDVRDAKRQRLMPVTGGLDIDLSRSGSESVRSASATVPQSAE